MKRIWQEVFHEPAALTPPFEPQVCVVDGQEWPCDRHRAWAREGLAYRQVEVTEVPMGEERGGQR